MIRFAGPGDHLRLRILRSRAFATPAQQEKLIGDNLGPVDFLAVLVLVAVRLKAAFDVDPLPFCQVGGHVLLAPEDDVVLVRLLFPLSSRLVF